MIRSLRQEQKAHLERSCYGHQDQLIRNISNVIHDSSRSESVVLLSFKQNFITQCFGVAMILKFENNKSKRKTSVSRNSYFFGIRDYKRYHIKPQYFKTIQPNSKIHHFKIQQPISSRSSGIAIRRGEKAPASSRASNNRRARARGRRSRESCIGAARRRVRAGRG